MLIIITIIPIGSVTDPIVEGFTVTNLSSTILEHFTPTNIHPT